MVLIIVISLYLIVGKCQYELIIMTKEELKQYLKENLKFEVSDHNRYHYLDDDGWDVTVKLEDEEITKFSLIIEK